jgi:hypothetical protein
MTTPVLAPLQLVDVEGGGSQCMGHTHSAQASRTVMRHRAKLDWRNIQRLKRDAMLRAVAGGAGCHFAAWTQAQPPFRRGVSRCDEDLFALRA